MREFTLARVLLRLLPARVRGEQFEPASADLWIEYGDRRPGTYACALVILWLDCWRLLVAEAITACADSIVAISAERRDVMHDIRYAFRGMMRQPGYAAVVIATLSIGIGASATMFSVVDGVLLKPLPYREPSSLIWMFGAFRLNDSAAVSPPDFLDYRARNEAFQSVGAMSIGPMGVTITGAGQPARLQASTVSADLISTLGVAPMLGRDFRREDEVDASRAVIISHRLWRDRFGGAPSVVGQTIAVDDRLRTIVGVMPAGFSLPYDAFVRLTDPVDLFLPIAFDDPDTQVRRFHFLRVIGRLKPGTTLERAQSQMNVIARQLEAAYPENQTWRLRLIPLQERIVGDVRPVLLVLMGAVGLLLLAACGNVAGLLLARATTRQQEVALRGALGASRIRIVRQLLVEGFVMSAVGGAAGLILTFWAIRVLKRVGPARFPRLENIALDPLVVAFALAAVAVTTLVFALAPAVRTTGGDLAAPLRPGKPAGHDRATGRLQRAVAAGQLAVSVALLVCAGLLARSFLRLVSVDTGFKSAGVLITRVALPPERYDTDIKIDRYFDELLRRLDAAAGVEAVGMTTGAPLTGANDTAVYRSGRPPATPEERRFAQFRSIRGDYFGTLGIPILAGRAFDDRLDHPEAPTTAVINRRFAREFFGDDRVIGEHVVIDLGTPVAAQIIGLTGDVRAFGQATEAPPMIYFSARQRPAQYAQIVIRTSLAVAEVTALVRGTVASLDGALSPSRVETIDALLADSVSEPRFTLLVIAAFAAVALVLSIVGLYGTLAYLVSQRRHEIGIRLALGATRGDIVRMVMRQGAEMIAAGMVCGLATALMTSRLAARLLFEVKPGDPLVFGGVLVLLTLASIAAILLPARRAARVEPLTALRAE
jgi:putative ABC transport system permease protein